MTDSTLTTKQEVGIERVRTYMLSPEVRTRFTDMMGPNAIYYLNQVLIVVASSKGLQECTPQSILIAAMRAASLKLSVDPSQGQAWIIPYNGVATYQTGYKGVYELAMRTNLYRYINVPQVYEGEEVVEDRMTGMHAIKGKRTGDRIIGWLLYFEMFNGFRKTFYMTVEQIQAHAEHYSSAYQNKASKWHDPIERPKMERKTVLVNGLRKWGRFNPGDADILAEIEQETPFISVIDQLPAEDEVTAPQAPKHTEAELMEQLTGEKQPASPVPAAEIVKKVTGEPNPMAWTSTKVSEETARTAQTSKGELYWDLQDTMLQTRRAGCEMGLKKEGLTQEQIDGYKLRIAVIDAILAYRHPMTTN